MFLHNWSYDYRRERWMGWDWSHLALRFPQRVGFMSANVLATELFFAECTSPLQLGLRAQDL